MALPTESSSPYQVNDQEAGTKKPLPSYIKYIIYAVLGVVVLSIGSFVGYRAYRKKHGLTKPEHVFPPSKCEALEFKQTPAMPEVEGDYEVPASISEALELNNFERFKVVPKGFSANVEGCWEKSNDNVMRFHPYNPKLAPYAATVRNMDKYKGGTFSGGCGLIRWMEKDANTFTIINFSTQKMRDYQYKTEGPTKFHLTPSLNAVAIETLSGKLSEVILLKNGTSLMGESLNGAEKYIPNSEYFYKCPDNEANLFTLIGNKMKDLGSIEIKYDIVHLKGLYVEPGVCAFTFEEDDTEPKSITVNRYAYDAKSKKFSAPTHILINLKLEDDEIINHASRYLKLWHLSTDKAKTTFEFMLGFGIQRTVSSATQSYATVKINDSEVVGFPAPLLLGVQAVDKNTVFYTDTKTEVTEIFKRKGTVPSA